MNTRVHRQPERLLMQSLVRRLTRIAVVVIAFLVLVPSPRPAGAQRPPERLPDRLPERIADSTYWRMITTMSEPDGYFRSENLVGNELSHQWVIPSLQKTLGTGGAYLGVAPDQNFTYMIALRPRIAFIVDIRRGAMLQHLLYKAILELSPTRADFLAMLLSRARPAGLDSTTDVDSLFRAYQLIRPDSATHVRQAKAIRERLTAGHGFALTDRDFEGMSFVYDAYYSAGPSLTYTFGNGNGFGGGFRGGASMPTYASMLRATDSAGVARSYLATEDGYRWLRDFESRNLLVPVVGDFAGLKALRAVGQWLRDHDTAVQAYYTSNVEQYLFMDSQNWRRYYENVLTMPIAPNALFIRSLSNGGGFRRQDPNSRLVQLLSSMQETLTAFREGRILSYMDVINLSKP